MNRKLMASMLIIFFAIFSLNAFASSTEVQAINIEKKEYKSKSLGQLLESFYKTTGIYALTTPRDNIMTTESHAEDSRLMTHFEQTWGRLIMFAICLILFYLAIAKHFPVWIVKLIPVFVK